MSLAQDIDGIKILHDWLGSGAAPVPADQAQARADQCRRGCHGEKCPYNHLGAWQFKDTAAATIRLWAEAKNRMRLRVDFEDELGTCSICSCNLPLKVQVPFKHIYDHTTDETLAKFPSWCWLTQEHQSPP